MPFEQGPYLEAALICERLLEEKDGVKSVIRIVDRLLIGATGSEVPEKMPPINTKLTLYIRLKSGMARGPFPLRINLLKPSGESLPPMKQIIHLEGEEDRAQDIVINLNLTIEIPGIYWFEIYFDENLLTKVPFRVLYTPQITQKYGQGGRS